MRFFLIIGVLLLHGCMHQHAPGVQTIPTPQAPVVGTYAEIYAKLEDARRDWQGVPYRHGGLTKAGVDCSGFVFLTFREQFGLPLPRTAQAQARIGQPVAMDDIQPGDLVFFKTKPSVNHVGIAMGDNKFLHASTKTGIKISSLTNTYWAARYWKAVRMPT